MGRLVGTVAALALLVASLLLGTASPLQAAVKDVRLTQDGPDPEVLLVGAGDTVRFVNADAFVHRVVSSSPGWAFDSRTLLPGQAYEVEPALTEPGRYAYRGAGLDDLEGAVTVQGATSAASFPSVRAGVSPTPRASGGPSPSAAGPSPGVPGSPTPALPAPDVAADAQAAPAVPVQPVVPGPLPGAPDPRRFGLPVALAVLAAGGVLSLLVRLLLAEPVAARGTR